MGYGQKKIYQGVCGTRREFTDGTPCTHLSSEIPSFMNMSVMSSTLQRLKGACEIMRRRESATFIS
jgi:hypothetical protein